MQKLKSKTCGICGKIFPGFHSAKYCSDECKAEAVRRQERARTEKRRELRRPKNMSIVEIARAARAEGLQYGEYVAKYGL